MRTGLTIAALAATIALAACSRTLDPPTAEEQARETHATIVSGANTLLRGDRRRAKRGETRAQRLDLALPRVAIGHLSPCVVRRGTLTPWNPGTSMG